MGQGCLGPPGVLFRWEGSSYWAYQMGGERSNMTGTVTMYYSGVCTFNVVLRVTMYVSVYLAFSPFDHSPVPYVDNYILQLIFPSSPCVFQLFFILNSEKASTSMCSPTSHIPHAYLPTYIHIHYIAMYTRHIFHPLRRHSRQDRRTTSKTYRALVD